jgi:tetratricopeptide (TPR) repeat protein
LVGDSILQYRVISRLGAGGMGEVYLAEDERLGRKVALKFLTADLAKDAEALERFRNEARLSAGLSHPNVASIHGFEESDGRWFHVHEYVEGETLEAIIRRGPVDLDTVRALAVDLARGLAHAHARGVIHRDLKPANVIVTPEGVAKILDFGLARRTGAAGPTLPGVALGTVAYMSPEQLQGGSIDHRSDLWAFGALLYEALTGRSPFAAPQIPAQLQRILNEDPTPVTNLRSDAPDDLCRIIENCLHKDPRDRFATADEILASLGLSVDLRQPVPQKSERRGTRTIMGGLAVVVVIVLAGLGYVLTTGNREPAEAIAETVTVQDEFGETTTQAVPAPGYRRRVTLFFAETAPDGEEWLAHGVPELLTIDLSQDAFIVARTPFYFIELVRREGSPDGLGLSRPIQRKIATSFELADRASVELRDVLRIPEVLDTEYPDLPVSEISTESEEAYRIFMEGTLAVAIDNDYQRAAERMTAAVEADSTFGLAHMSAFVVRGYMQDVAGLTESAELAMRYLYRLPPKNRFAMKANYYMNIERDPDKALAVTRMWTQLHPEDEDAFRQLAAFHMFRGESEEQVAALEHVLQIDPSDFDTLQNIGTIYREMGRYDDAARWLEKFVTTYPERASGRIELARLYIDMAQRERALKELDEVLLLENRNPDALRALAEIEVREGQFVEARARLEQALRAAATATERAAVHDDIRDLDERQGRIEDAQRQVAASRAASAEIMAPLQVTISTLATTRLFALRNDVESGLEFARAERARMAVQFRGAAALGLVPLFLEAAATDSARVYIDELASFADTYKLEIIRPVILMFEAELAGVEGDFEAALANLDALAQLRPESVRSLRMRSQFLRELGRLDAAESAIDRSLELDPHHPESQVERARLMLARSRADEAQRALESALGTWENADPEFVRLLDANQLLESISSAD